jgi:hypothetical protein
MTSLNVGFGGLSLSGHTLLPNPVSLTATTFLLIIVMREDMIIYSSKMTIVFLHHAFEVYNYLADKSAYSHLREAILDILNNMLIYFPNFSSLWNFFANRIAMIH